MNSKKSPIAAVIWTVIAVIALIVLFFFTSGIGTFTKICGLVLVIMCVVGQWLKFFKGK